MALKACLKSGLFSLLIASTSAGFSTTSMDVMGRTCMGVSTTIAGPSKFSSPISVVTISANNSTAHLEVFSVNPDGSRGSNIASGLIHNYDQLTLTLADRPTVLTGTVNYSAKTTLNFSVSEDTSKVDAPALTVEGSVNCTDMLEGTLTLK